MKNLVMAAAQGYGWHELEPFIISFKKNCPDADLVLFADNLSEFTLQRLNEENLKIIPVPAELKNKLIVDARWEMYKNFLDTHTEYENIFVTDVKDVIFQGDLFLSYADYKNFLVYATEAELIKNDRGGNNQNWIRHLFGDIEYQKIKDNQIICCGTVLGSRAEMSALIENMIEFLKRSTAWGDEQAAMNYLIHNKLLPIENLIESNVNDGAIFTVGIIGNSKVSGEKILRGDGNIPAVVHQYDRHAPLLQLVDNLYHEKTFEPKENLTDIQSAIDQIFCMVQTQNFSAATKFFVAYVLYSKNLQAYNNKILKLGQLILRRYNTDAEILLSAVQNVLPNIFVEGVSFRQMEDLYNIFINSEKNFNCVSPSFKFFVKNMTATFIDIFYNSNKQKLAKMYVRRLIDWRD